MIYVIIAIILIILYFLRKYIKGGVNTKTHDLKDKFIIVTGASSGIGRYSAIHLVKSNAKVIFACRTEEKAKKALEEIPLNLRKNAEYIYLDLCSFDSIIKFSNLIKEKYPKIDILMNNAGAQPRNYIFTKDKYESYIEGNYIGPFLLSILLIPHMNIQGRIINLSSIGHKFAIFDKNIISFLDNPDELKKKYFTGKYTDSLNLYCITKVFLMYFTDYLKNVFEKKNMDLKIVSLHPGSVNTDFVRFIEDYFILNILFKIFYPLLVYLTKTIEDGAQTQLYLSYLDYNELISGAYYSDCKLDNIAKIAKDEELKNLIIDWTIKGLKERLPDNNLIQELSI